MTSPRPAKGRSEGQWALGERDPLNPNEQFKRDDDALNVHDRVLNHYAKAGFDSIDKNDLRGRLRWAGLYTQREQGYDGSFTGDENIDLLEARYFMMRVRCDGGALSTAALRTLGQISTVFARDTADISDRENVQYHWIEIEDVPEIWERLAAVGLQTTEACGDCPRVVLGSPLAGESVDEILDPTWAIEEIVRRYIGNPEFSNLPRKYKTAISGLQDVAHEINDVSFVGVTGPDGRPGYDLWVGGGLSTNPMLARRLGVFVSPDRVPAVWGGVAGLFRDYGYRRLRSRARLKFLVADWGAERFREVLEKEYLGGALPDGPEPPAPPPGARDHVGVHRQRDGVRGRARSAGAGQTLFYLGMAPNVGRTSGTQLWQVADLAEEYGSGTIRTTTEQKLLILDVPGDRVADLTEELAARDLQVNPSAFRRGTMACTGIEFCKLAIVETKGRARDLYTELDRRLPGFDTPITINVNGCPNSCARFQLADIGLKGSIVDGQEGFQVHLGGSLVTEPGFGRKLRGLKVTADALPDYVERLLRNYQADRTADEQFAGWVRRADAELLT